MLDGLALGGLAFVWVLDNEVRYAVGLVDSLGLDLGMSMAEWLDSG